MFGNYYNQFPNYGNGGYYYGGQPQQLQPQEQTVFNQLLTADEVAKLKKSPNFSSTKLTEDEYLRALCTHHSNNEICLELVPSTGKHRCSICGAEFNLVTVDAGPEVIERTCNDFYDLLQSIKTYYGNAPTAMREFYIMIGFIPKIQHLWNIAKQYFNRTVGGNPQYSNLNGDQNGFVTLNNILGNGNMGGIAPTLGGNYMGYPQAGYYGGAPVPQAAYMQTPQAPPPQMMPQQPQYVNPQPMQQQQAGYQVMQQQQMQQQPMYGYGYPCYGAPPPAPPISGGNNPIGYVTNNQQDFTQNKTNQAGQQVSQTQTPPLPNPNLTNPNNIKADVGKRFT